MTVTRDELDRIESGIGAATPGPWQAGYWDDARTPLENFDTSAPDDATGGSVYAVAPEAIISVADARTLSRGSTGEGESVRPVALPLRPHDAAFIASARQDVPALVAALRECDRRFAALSPNGDLLDALLAVLSSPGNGAARAHLALIASRGAGLKAGEVDALLARAFDAAPVPVAGAAHAFAEVELSPANAAVVRPMLPRGETWELTPEEAVELESLMRAPRGAPGTLAHDPKPVPDVSELMRENARLRAALEPFARAGRGLPDNWPPQCPYTVQTHPPEGSAKTAHPCYESADLASPGLPTIGDLYAAARAYDAASEPEGAT